MELRLWRNFIDIPLLLPSVLSFWVVWLLFLFGFDSFLPCPFFLVRFSKCPICYVPPKITEITPKLPYIYGHKFPQYYAVCGGVGLLWVFGVWW
jgi:hypothetical protein